MGSPWTTWLLGSRTVLESLDYLRGRVGERGSVTLTTSHHLRDLLSLSLSFLSATVPTLSLPVILCLDPFSSFQKQPHPVCPSPQAGSC